MKKWASFWACAVAGALVLLGVAPVLENVRGAIPIPHNSWGHPYDETGVLIVADEWLTSWIDGVEYGRNLTYSYDFNIWYDIDTHGDWMLNLTTPETPWVKEGGNIDDPIMYAWGDFTEIDPDPEGDGVFNSGVFEESQLWMTTLVVREDLNLSATQPPMYPKISWIVPEPDDGLLDYVLIYTKDPFFDMSGFYLEKNDGSLNGPVQTLSGESNATAYFYASLDDIDLHGCGDELKLVWNNTGPAFGGRDIIVDRVEWNATVGGCHYFEPDNTIMTDAAAPSFGSAIHRTGSFPVYADDTNDNEHDFVEEISWPRPVISPPWVTILTPQGGDVLAGDSGEGLTWIAYDDNALNSMLRFWVNYSLDDGGTWAPAVLGLSQPFFGWGDAVTPMSVNWSVPLVNNSQARISICVDNPVQLVTCSISDLFSIDPFSPDAEPRINGVDHVRFYKDETIDFQLWADVSDDRMVAGAVYTIGRGNFPGYPMSSSDGFFDEMNEVVKDYGPQLPPPPFPSVGTYEYCVYAFDEAGNMNQDSCVVLELTDNPSDEDTVAPDKPDLSSISALPDFNSICIDNSTSTDVWLYALHYSNQYKGTYAVLEEWTLDELPYPCYQHAGAGSNNPDDFYYRLYVADHHMNWAASGVVAKINVDLASGVQSLALPVINDEPVHLSQIWGSFSNIHYFDPTDAVDPWKLISIAKPYQDSYEFEFGRGYWIDMTANDTIVAMGSVPASVTYNLVAGWNFIGYCSPYARLVGDALSSITEYKVEGISDVEPYHLRTMSSSSVLEPFNAYWIWVPSDVTWILQN